MTSGTIEAQDAPGTHAPPSPGPTSACGSDARDRAWILSDVVAPFLASRCLLLFVGWFADLFVANPRYPASWVTRQGWQFTSVRLLDMWGRWDSGWYMDIALHGYSPSPSYETVQSSIAFFPLFPMIVRGVLKLLPASADRPTAALLTGIVLSNGALVMALLAIRQLVAQLSDRTAARRAVLYVVTFPTSFFLSCFYPESLFLALSALACLLVVRNCLVSCAIAGSLAALCRPYGVMVLLPLGWLYMSSRGWALRRIRLDALAFLLVPAAPVAFLVIARPLTGHLLAPFGAQAAWHRHLSWPWTTLTSSLYFEGPITRVQQIFAVAVCLLSLWAVVRLRSRAYGLYAIAATLPSLVSGTLMGIGRHAVVVFPLYMALALMSRRERVHELLLASNLTVQVLFMAAWVRFYPVV